MRIVKCRCKSHRRVSPSSFFVFRGFNLLHMVQTKPTAQPSPSPDQRKTANSTITATPSEETRPEGHVIADKPMFLNSSQDFINPKDQKESILVRLPNGAFAAYESACTHQEYLLSIIRTRSSLSAPCMALSSILRKMVL